MWLSDRVAKAGPFVRSFLALGAQNYVSMALAFLLSVVLTRRLGVASYGQLAILLMVAQVFLLATANWTHIGFVRFASQEFSTSSRVAGAFWSRMLLALPAAAVCVAAMAWWRPSIAAYIGVPPWVVGVLLAQCAAAFALQALGGIFQARQEMARFGTTLVLEKGLLLAFVVALPLAATDVSMVLALYAAAAALVAIGSLLWIGPRAFLPVACGSTARQMAAFSLPLLLSSWAGFFGGNWFDLVVIRKFRPVSDVGLYSLGWQLAAVAQQITIVFSTLLLPKLSVMVIRGDDAGIRQFLRRALPQWLLGTSLLFSVVLLVAAWAVPMVFGRDFGGAAPVLALLMIASSALAVFNGLVPLVSARGLTWTLSGVTLLSAVTNVLLDLVLVPSYGIAGSACATVVAYWVSAGLVLVLVQRRFGHVRHLPWLIAPVPVIYVILLLVPDPASQVAGWACAAAGTWSLLRMQRSNTVVATEDKA